ncbi:aspartate aminotransferase [Paraliobacillus ryukyuensis]|uniref:Aminotransferase n=1 Tax=Paraliobacillus ryukyuensis TaxID=200904 RepID=A0A366EIK7_9BACI|nr:pyridoxal phosphate-dependent aminotransferase [Paraliobacillus ryukyuensis]RBP01560.1 aspartate aminotransferase [Paraliobacillus ryukyuensis]
MKLADRVNALTPSTTLAITAKAKSLKNEGHDVIGLGAGEPDFNTPSYILDAAKEAMDQGFTKYTASGGTLELKQAIIDKMKSDHALNYTEKEVIVTTGAKHALYTLFQVILNPDDEVIIPAPYWVSYPEQIKLAQGQPVFVNAEEQNNFKITREQLQQAITEKTKAIIINSPSNPTGVMYSKEELEALGEVCLEHGLLIISDEIYEKLIYTQDKHVSIAQLSKDLKEQTIIINGVSKSHAMTGWRIGYAVGNQKIIQAMTNLASHSTSNPTSIAQAAALKAYTDSREQALSEMKAAFTQRLNTTYEWLTAIPGITCVKPKGAFYLFPNVKQAVEMNGFDSVDAWVEALLEEEKVALVPGSGFGSPNNVRLSYATGLDQLEEATKRIQHFVETHQV